MADENSQRPYRTNDTPGRPAPGRASPSGSDPLAELARLIGQSDPFSEFGRENARRAAAPPAAPETAAEWAQPPEAVLAPPRMPAPAARPPMPAAPPRYSGSNFARQPFGGAPLAGSAEPDQHQFENDAYAGAHADGQAAGGYEHPPYTPSNSALGSEEDDFYDDVQPRRRMGIIAIAGIFALAVIGTAGAFGYRAIFGSSSAPAQPPVIKADTAPSKIVPQASKDATSKLINDRLADRGQGEKLVSREEQPIDMKDKPAGVVYPRGVDTNSSSTAALGSGVVGSEPKKIRTIAIHPDQQSNVTDAAPAVTAPPPPPAPQRVAPPFAAAAPPPARTTSNAPLPEAQPDPPVRAPAPRAAPPAPSNAPLSLNPNAIPARPAARAPVRTAAVGTPATVAPPAAAANRGGAGSYAVQVSSQRSEGDAQAAFRGLQGKFPNQLGGKQPLIHRVDLGAKGIYFRAMVGPFATAGEASELCSSLKAAGGQCIVQRN